jgi:hypothetical protein
MSAILVIFSRSLSIIGDSVVLVLLMVRICEIPFLEDFIRQDVGMKFHEDWYTSGVLEPVMLVLLMWWDLRRRPFSSTRAAMFLQGLRD